MSFNSFKTIELFAIGLFIMSAFKFKFTLFKNRLYIPYDFGIQFNSIFLFNKVILQLSFTY